MAISEPKAREEARTTTKLVLWLFIFSGLLLIAISILLPHDGIGGYFHEFLKELGIVILSVFAISLVYELLVAEKYLKYFLDILRDQVEQGESNAAICAHLGILQIFPRREIYERKYPITDLASSLAPGSCLRTIGRSLFILLTKAHAIKKAIQQGAQVDLCLLDPASSPEEIAQSPDIEIFDIHSAISIFKKEIAEWVKETSPPGQVALRFHRIPLLDSFFLLKSADQQLCTWELTFSRDIGSKRIFQIDPSKQFGVDLLSRYERVWNNALRAFEYDGQKVTIDRLQNPSEPHSTNG